MTEATAACRYLESIHEKRLCDHLGYPVWHADVLREAFYAGIAFERGEWSPVEQLKQQNNPGWEVPLPEPLDHHVSVTCPHCGYATRGSANYCSDCGHVLRRKCSYCCQPLPPQAFPASDGQEVPSLP